jgi:hypothetical protein
MSPLAKRLTERSNLADLLEHLGGIDASRVRLFPPPGEATEEDVTRIDEHENRRCELIDGVLVEKRLGVQESFLVIVLIRVLQPSSRRTILGWFLPRTAQFNWTRV